MSNQTLKKAIKKVRTNKTKEQIVDDMKHQEKVAHIKDVVRGIFPYLEKVDTVYDAQTVVNALSGFIAALIEKNVAEIKLGDLDIDLSKEEDSKIKTAIQDIIRFEAEESAQELSETLERLGTTLQAYIVHKHMSAPMETIKIDDLVSK